MKTSCDPSLGPSLEVGIPESIIIDYSLTADVSVEEATIRARELEKFLAVCGANSSGPRVPSPIVDEIWHDFILHTRQYAEFCQRNFGRFLHHRPNRSGSRPLGEAYLATIADLQKAFGPVHEAYWPHSDGYLAETCNVAPCGQCDGDS